MEVLLNPKGLTLREKYPTCEPFYLVDSAVTIKPQSIQELKSLTGLTLPELKKALKELEKMGLITHKRSQYWAE